MKKKELKRQIVGLERILKRFIDRGTPTGERERLERLLLTNASLGKERDMLSSILSDVRSAFGARSDETLATAVERVVKQNRAREVQYLAGVGVPSPPGSSVFAETSRCLAWVADACGPESELVAKIKSGGWPAKRTEAATAAKIFDPTPPPDAWTDEQPHVVDLDAAHAPRGVIKVGGELRARPRDLDDYYEETEFDRVMRDATIAEAHGAARSEQLREAHDELTLRLDAIVGKGEDGE